jgi:hypothetical protein
MILGWTTTLLWLKSSWVDEILIQLFVRVQVTSIQRVTVDRWRRGGGEGCEGYRRGRLRRERRGSPRVRRWAGGIWWKGVSRKAHPGEAVAT